MIPSRDVDIRTECTAHEPGEGTCEMHADGPWVYCFGCLLRSHGKLHGKLDRARSAGRRLAIYWRVQTDGADSLMHALNQNWRAKLNKALGTEDLLLTDICDIVLELQKQPSEIQPYVGHMDADYLAALSEVWKAKKDAQPKASMRGKPKKRSIGKYDYLLAVDCRRCGALEGSRCVTVSGNISRFAHIARYDDVEEDRYG